MNRLKMEKIGSIGNRYCYVYTKMIIKRTGGTDGAGSIPAGPPRIWMYWINDIDLLLILWKHQELDSNA